MVTENLCSKRLALRLALLDCCHHYHYFVVAHVYVVERGPLVVDVHRSRTHGSAAMLR